MHNVGCDDLRYLLLHAANCLAKKDDRCRVCSNFHISSKMFDESTIQTLIADLCEKDDIKPEHYKLFPELANSSLCDVIPENSDLAVQDLKKLLNK